MLYIIATRTCHFCHFAIFTERTLRSPHLLLSLMKSLSCGIRQFWSLTTVQRDMSGTMGFNEFKELWAVLNGWRQHFISFDSDRSGTVDPPELQKALMTMGSYSQLDLSIYC